MAHNHFKIIFVIIIEMVLPLTYTILDSDLTIGPIAYRGAAKCFESCCKLTQFLNCTKCEGGRVITKTVVTCSLSGVGCTNLMLGSWWSLIVEQTDGRHSRLSYSVCRSVVYVYIGLQGGGQDLTTHFYIFSRPVALCYSAAQSWLWVGSIHGSG